jgi:tRNA uridine 5-carboxymethylaminomethyl modification enzyme
VADPRNLPIEATFDVLIVGGGHAGAEAAVAAARTGARTALVTSALETIGQMSCNPAIGGVAKGTVVREVDALGGVMAKAADRATLQFRLLNRSKGPAVWAPRAQCDRGLYRRAVRRLLDDTPGLALVQGTVTALTFDGPRVDGLVTLDGRRFAARAVVLTTGTFLRGKIHIGTDTAVAGGRAGEGATTHLAQQLERAGLAVARFKTGTPPRIDGRTVAFDRLERQDSELDELDFTWSHFARADRLPQRPCWITWTAPATHQVVQDHLAESAMYGGAIGARGPRYCPSIEDKVLRFVDADRHQVFLEPEGLDTDELYVNGLSTSLAAPVQVAMLRSVPGLERVAMTRAGYAIEYDYLPPTQLDHALQVRAIPGLFCAGQINGTTGYEEAAGQGVVAGLNAGRAARDREPVVLGRESAYLGVLVDDLVSRGVDEPYRLFTSRSEFRLTVRQDNALTRLGPIAERLGLYTEAEARIAEDRRAAEGEVLARAARSTVPLEAANRYLTARGGRPLPHAVRVDELARRHDCALRDLLALADALDGLSTDALVSAELELKYAGYVARERRAAERVARQAAVPLPAELPYEHFATLSTEARQRLAAQRPATLAQAARLPGVNPTDVQNLVLEVERWRRRTTAV